MKKVQLSDEGRVHINLSFGGVHSWNYVDYSFPFFLQIKGHLISDCHTAGVYM